MAYVNPAGRVHPGPELHHHPDHRRRRATAIRSSPAATAWSSAGPARGPTGRSSCGGCSAWRTCCRWASPGRRTTSAAGPSTSTRAAATRCSASSGCRRPTSSASPDYERGITVPAIVDIPTGQVVTNDFAQITLDLSTGVDGVPPRRRARPLPGARCATRSTRSTSWSSRDVNNGVYRCGFAGDPGGVRAGVPAAVRPARLAVRAARRPALPGRRHDHRGRRAAVHHAGPLRRRLPRPLQVQPAEAHRDAGAVGLRARPVPDARASATRSTSSTSSSTTTWCTGTSTRPGSCRPGRTCRAG